MRTSWKDILIVGISAAVFCSPVIAKKPSSKYPKGLFSFSAVHFDATGRPCGIVCAMGSPEGKAILGSIATAFGVAPIYVSIASAVIPTSSVQGQQTNYVLPIPPGYAPCAAKISVVSIVPASGQPHSTLNSAINPNEIQMTLVTPTLRGLAPGNSWVEGDAVYFGVKPQFLDEFVKKGVCKPVTQHVFLYSCTDRNACSTPGTWGNPAAAGRTTASLKKVAGSKR